MVYELPANFAGGEFFIGWRGRKFSASDFDDYFEVVDSARPLFAQPDFNDSTIGFYLNRIGPTDNVALRLHYFSRNVPETIRVVEQFVNDSRDLEIQKGNHANRDKPIAHYNDGSLPSELAFKNFLDANNRICLEMLQNFGRTHTRNLIRDYIGNGLLQQGKRPDSAVTGHFAEHSGTYRDLTQRDLARRYWDDVFHWHRVDAVGMHFMCNMLVVADPPYGHPAIRGLFQQPLIAP